MKTCSLADLESKLKTLLDVAQEIKNYQIASEEQFRRFVEPFAQNEGDKNWLWDFCFNNHNSSHDDYSDMVNEKVLAILRKNVN